MKSRCYYEQDKSYHRYGGRGIEVCERWRKSFAAFLEDMGRKPSRCHTLDRLRVDGNYEPGNCRWATQIEQQNNRRSNRVIEIDGGRLTIADAVRRYGIRRDKIKRAVKASGERLSLHEGRLIGA